MSLFFRLSDAVHRETAFLQLCWEPSVAACHFFVSQVWSEIQITMANWSANEGDNTGVELMCGCVWASSSARQFYWESLLLEGWPSMSEILRQSRGRGGSTRTLHFTQSNSWKHFSGTLSTAVRMMLLFKVWLGSKCSGCSALSMSEWIGGQRSFLWNKNPGHYINM